MIPKTTAKHYVAATAILPAAALLIWPGSRLLAAGCLIWIFIVAIYWIRNERAEHRDRVTGTIKALQASGVRTLNHHRHDWMNDLQVLYGYIRLGKPDKMVGCVEKIRDRMNAESSISRLGVPSLVSYIQSFRTITNSITLEVEVEEGVNLQELVPNAESVAETLIHTINAYRSSVKPGTGEQALLRLRLAAVEGILYAAFYYDGELINEQQWKQKMNEQLKGASLSPVSEEQSYNEIVLKTELRELGA
jgi:stage 0 sporulation protein B (sporulation initiation phosphotransferase)